MRMRLAEEEDKAAAARAAAVTNRLLKESQVVEHRETLREEGGNSWIIMRGGIKEGISTVGRETAEKTKEASEDSPPIELMARSTTEQTTKEVAVRSIEQFNTEKSRESNKSGEEKGHKGCEQIATEEPEFRERCEGGSLKDETKKSKEVLSAAMAVKVTEEFEFEISPQEGQVVRSTERESMALQPQPAIPPPGSPTASVAVSETPVDHAVAAPEVPFVICATNDERVVQRKREDSDGPHSIVASREREKHRDLGATAKAEGEGGGSSETREGEAFVDNVKSCVGGGGGDRGSDGGGVDTVEGVEHVGVVEPSTILNAKVNCVEGWGLEIMFHKVYFLQILLLLTFFWSVANGKYGKIRDYIEVKVCSGKVLGHSSEQAPRYPMYLVSSN